ncbi:ribonuclease H-like domain-containing protein [bacterium 210820-DFI.6.37]|nr:ribonuclease H-like domain-containing protein [bacterium 210820-DFI.6.37]
MEYITDYITESPYTSRAFQLYFGGMKISVLDIETTGLSPKHSSFVLGGLLTPESGALKAEQFFAEDLSQEQETLQAFLDAFSETDVLITYNGRHFDIPFIKGRAGQKADDLPFNLDLYLLVKQYAPFRKFLPNLKQKTVENFLGLWQDRKDEISGKESVELYYQYLSRKDPEIKETILLHNYDDILQLHRLLRVLEKTDLHRAMFHMGFPVGSQAFSQTRPVLAVEKISLTQGFLEITGRQRRRPAEYRRYELEGIPCSAHFSRSRKTFSLALPVIRQSGLTVLDLKALRMEFPPLEKYPSCQQGFLILEEQKEKHYLEINHFTKLFLERILNQWITKNQ